MEYFLRSGRAVKADELRDVVSADRASAKVWEACYRCCGDGYIPHFMHVANGICFACNNAKGRYKVEPCYSAEKLGKLEAAADKRAEKKAAKIEALRLDNLNKSIALVGDNLWVDIKAWRLPIASEELWGLTKNDRLIAELFDKASAAVNGGLSEKAAALLVKVWENKLKWAAERAEKDANAVDVEEGRYEVEGKVLSVREYHSDFGTNFKMLVDCGDYRVFGSVPAAIRRAGLLEELPGKEVSFTGTFTAKETGFGFFSRPSKAEIKEEA
jgi:hypothetical protein